MSSRPQVVLLDLGTGEADEWERAIGAAAEVRRAQGGEELATMLLAAPADVLVAPCDAKLLDSLQHNRGAARVIFCGAMLPEGIIDAAGQGYDLRHVSSSSQLRREVIALGRPRSLMVRHKLPGLTMALGDGPPVEVLDLSNRGLSFRLDLHQEFERYLPGETLSGLRVLRGGELALEAARAFVRYIELAHDGQGLPFYRVGCELPPRRASENAAPTSRIDDGITIAGLLRTALRHGSITLQPADDDQAESCSCERGVVDLANGELQFESVSPFAGHQVLRGVFELGGSSYRFLAAVIQTVPLRIGLPNALEATHRRSSARYRPMRGVPIEVKLSSPLLSESEAGRRVLELSTTGLSFAVDPALDLFPPGLQLRLEMQLEGYALLCRGEVRNLTPLAGSKSMRCGVSFIGLSAKDQSQLADALMRHRFPGLADGSEYPVEKLWQFLGETRFLYPAKLESLTPMLTEVYDSFHKLYATRGHVFKSIVFQESNALAAHLSAVQAYRHSWLIQHLAGTTHRHGMQGPRLVNLGITEYLAQNPEVEYGKVFFRPDNKWPARVFGGYARRLADRHRSDVSVFDYLLLRTDTALPDTPGIRIIEARGRDLIDVEGHLVATQRGMLLRSDDLTRKDLLLEAVDAKYRSVGLFRQRFVLLALQGDQPAAFALCELSSPGLNLSELLSSTRLYLLSHAARLPAQAQLALRTALLREAFALYRRSGRASVPLLCDPGDVPLLPAMAPLAHKQYAGWTGHRSLLRHFGEYVERLYERIERAQERKAARREAKISA